MQQKIFDTKNSFEFFTKSRKIVLEEETKLEMNPSSKFGLDIIDTGNFHLIISTELTEEFIGISNDSLKKHPILLKLVREEKMSGEKYLVFSTIPIPNEIIFHVEMFLEKTIIVHYLMKLVSSNRDNFSTQKLLKVIGLDLQEYLDLEDNFIKQTKFIINDTTEIIGIDSVKYRKSCLICYTYSPFPHEIMWHDDQSLYEDGELIWEEDMIKKILEWYNKTDFKCENCGAKNNWDIWDVTINDKKLKCEEPKVHLILKDGRLKVYEILDFAYVIKTTIRELDLNLERLNIPQVQSFDSKNAAERITIMEVMSMMSSFFEVNFFPDKEIYNEALDYFRGFCGIRFNQKELNQLKNLLSTWEKSIIEDTTDDCYNFLEYDPAKILPKIYPNIPENLQTEEVYKYFRLQYFKTKHRLTHEFEQISIEMKLTKNRQIVNHMLKIMRSKHKL